MLSEVDLRISSVQVLHLRHSCYKELRKKTRKTKNKKNTVGKPPKLFSTDFQSSWVIGFHKNPYTYQEKYLLLEKKDFCHI